MGRLSLVTYPWAEVYIDRKKVGQTPQLKEIKLSPGPHKLKLISPFRVSHVERIEIAAGKTLRMKIKLKPVGD